MVQNLVLTPAQKEARHKEKVEAFKTGLHELEKKTGMTLMVSLRYLPTGIFPVGTIVELPVVNMETPKENAKKTETEKA